MTHFLTLALTLSLSLAACADSKESIESTQQNAEVATAPEAVAAPSVVDPLAIEPVAPLAEADLAEYVRTIEPQKARNGELRISSAQLSTPAAAKMLLERLSSERDSESVKKALVIALPRTQGDYASGAVALLKTEKSSDLRAALVDSMRLAKDADSALKGLSIGLADSSAQVRSRAAYNLGHRTDGLALEDELLAALSDSDAGVQSAAAKALGHLESSKGFAELEALLGSRSADVRLESLRAMGRIDAERASELSQLAELGADDDARVRTAAGKVTARAY